MKIELQKKEATALIELVYLGNWLANSSRLIEFRIAKYDALLDMVLALGKKSRDDLYDDVCEIINQQESDIFPSLFAKMMAEYLYPDRHGKKKETISYNVFCRLCEEEIKNNGVEHIQIHLPQLEDEIEHALKKTIK